jgi:hypothetical protein
VIAASFAEKQMKSEEYVMNFAYDNNANTECHYLYHQAQKGRRLAV